LALAAPAAVAGYAYLDAKLGLEIDYRLIGGLFKCNILGIRREKKDRLNHFYQLEHHALSSHSNRILLIFEGRQWTYKEVYEKALSYGTWLKQKHNVKSKEIVAVDFVNSEQFVFLWFGLWSIGAKPAFINYNLTSKALAHCIRVSTARLVLVDPDVAENVTQEVKDELKDIHFETLTPDLQVEAVTTKGVRQPDSERSEDRLQNLSMLIYTSGTTGLPKPAIVSWNKVITGANIVPWWLHFQTSDIFYSVSSHPLDLHQSNKYSACHSTTPPQQSSVSAWLSITAQPTP
jgi:acyl-CoA synthetase (AMP-forming)/AMP-acid ligase II